MSFKTIKHRLLIFIVTYNAEKTIASVLNRIPSQIFEDQRYDSEILIIDDGSKDSTFGCGIHYKQSFKTCPLTILKNPNNLGYGGNQKLGYRYAIDHDFSIVALLHGDGQYAPEELPKLLEPLLQNENSADAVFGSRMMKSFDALIGGMPKYKFIGNKVLTFAQNRLADLNLSEWHSGYRLYSCALLKKIPFELNSNGFDFDTDIIVQIKAFNGKIVELPIPTFYGDEISHVNVLQYGVKILLTCLQFRIQKLSLLYDPKFDLESQNNQYKEKFSFESSHSLPLKTVKNDDSCLIIGCGPIELIKPFLNKCKKLALIDLFISPEIRALNVAAWEIDIDACDLSCLFKDQYYNKIFALDVIEHLKSPENLCRQIRNLNNCPNAELILTTPNIAFLPIRLMLLIGLFNYGKRGILDRSHTRLFTYSSIRRLLVQSGYEILEIRGIPAPFPLALGDSWLAHKLLKINSFLCKILPGLFSYQLYVRAKVKPTVSHLLNEAEKHAEAEAAKLNLQN